MSEECTHDCSTCGSSCEHVDAKDLIAPLNKDSSIKHVYAIMSGKGGVGKSSTTASLATAMAKRGYKVGIMDADITGPSIPTAFGLDPRAVGDGESIFPERRRGGQAPGRLAEPPDRLPAERDRPGGLAGQPAGRRGQTVLDRRALGRAGLSVH